METTLGKLPPLGTERLKICELFAEFIHLQYLFTSSPLFDLMVVQPPKENGDTVITVADGLITLTEGFIQESIMEKCIVIIINQDLFFAFPWNNFIHSVVYDMVAKVFNTFSFTANLPSDLSGGLGNTSDASNLENIDQTEPNSFPQIKMKVVRQTVKGLIVSIFKKGSLIKQIITAQQLNDYNEEQPKGVRLGYMGHITYISDEICKLFEKCAPELDDELHGAFD